MSDILTQQSCEACRADATPVSAEELAQLLPQLPQWRIVQPTGTDQIQRCFVFGNFAQALAFTQRVGALAEEVGHHPALLTEWGKVTVTWWSHEMGGLHRNDLIMAAKTDLLYPAEG